jgi:Concanavalin A-like lectin/glucanases superfamily
MIRERSTDWAGCLLLAVVALVSLSLPASAKTVAWYRFEGGEGREFAGGVGAVRDSSGNHLDGTCISDRGAAYTEAIAPFGETALRMRDKDDWVFVPECPKLQLARSLTVEAWLNIRSFQRNGSLNFILFRGDNRSGFDAFWLAINPHSQDLVFGIEGPKKKPGPPVIVTTPFTYLRETIHVAGVLDDETGFLGLYVNGRLKDSLRTDVRPWKTLDPREQPGLGIGGFFAGPRGSFTIDGTIDEARMSDRALKPADFLVKAPRVTLSASSARSAG